MGSLFYNGISQTSIRLRPVLIQQSKAIKTNAPNLFRIILNYPKYFVGKICFCRFV